MLPEVISQGTRRLPLGRAASASLNSRVLDGVVSRRVGSPDVLHVNTAGLVRSVRKAKQRGALIVADHREVHPHDHTGRDPLTDRLEVELEAADWVLANSERAARSLIRWGLPAAKVVTIPLGVDVSVFSPDGAGRPRAEGPPRLLYVGALIPAKGVADLLAALQTPALRGFTLKLCGLRVDAELASRCEAADRVSVLGAVSRTQLVREYREADVLVLPSHNDAFGLVAVEALACGTPVVVTSECGVSAMITRDVGRVTPPHAVGELSRAILEAQELAHRSQTSERARGVAAQASWETYESTLASFYSRTVFSGAALGVLREDG